MTPHSVERIDLPIKTPRNPKFPCNICKGGHLLKDHHALSPALEVWSKASQQHMLSSFGHHVDHTPSTNDSIVKSRKGKVRNSYLLYKDMHLNYFFIPWMTLQFF